MVGDLNADGKPDLVVVNQAASANVGGTGSISILLQDPANPGKFFPTTDYVTGSRSTSIAIGDLNSDGKPDLGVANSKSLSPRSYQKHLPSLSGSRQPGKLSSRRKITWNLSTCFRGHQRSEWGWGRGYCSCR
jgi:hypothetical protein